MSKQSKCPYCSAQIDYKHRTKYVKDKSKEVKCIKCGKLMKMSYRRAAAFWGFVFFVGLIGINTVYLFFTKNKTIIPNLVLTVVFIVIYMLIVPQMAVFRKIPGQEDALPKLKKNRHRHKKDKNDKIEFEEDPIKNTAFDK